jgi:hypothetical protein
MVAAYQDRCFVLDVECWRCGKITCVIVNKEDLVDWTVGSGPIEEILYYLSDNERELILSNTCGPCFDSLFNALDNQD